jgi:hypothetical protein
VFDDAPEIDANHFIPICRRSKDVAARLYSRIIHQYIDTLKPIPHYLLECLHPSAWLMSAITASTSWPPLPVIATRASVACAGFD